MKKEKNYGIELLRLISMFMIVTLHVLGEGGILSNVWGINYKIAWLLEIFSYCSVNVFALITGYVSYSDKEKKIDYSKYISFWIPVCFYSVVCYIFSVIYSHQSINTISLLKSFFPVIFSKYWYVNAYTGLFFLIPWINKLLINCSKKEIRQITVVLLIIFSGISNVAIPFSDPFTINRGYSVIWLAILFVVGAYIKKNNVGNNNHILIYPLVFLINIIFIWLWKIYSPIVPNIFVCYLSVPVVIAAISLFIFFKRLTFKNFTNKFINFFSVAAFGVYLIHSNSNIASIFITKKFANFVNSSSPLFIFKVCLTTIIIFISCLLIEKVRQYLFKLLRFDKIIAKIQININALYNKLLKKISLILSISKI